MNTKQEGRVRRKKRKEEGKELSLITVLTGGKMRKELGRKGIRIRKESNPGRQPQRERRARRVDSKGRKEGNGWSRTQ